MRLNSRRRIRAAIPNSGVSLVSLMATMVGCQSVGRSELSDLKRAERHEVYLACFNDLYDPANPYHNMFGMQRACSKYAKARVP